MIALLQPIKWLGVLLAFFCVQVVTAETIKLKIAAPLPVKKLPELSGEIVRGLEAGGRVGVPWCNWEGKRQLSVDLSIWDDEANGNHAVKIAEEIVRFGADVVIGHPNSGTAIPASVVYEKAGLLNISVGATNPLFTNRNLAYNFRMPMDDFLLSRLMGEYVRKLVADQPVFLHDGTAYGKEVVAGVGKSFGTSSGEPMYVDIGVDGGSGVNKINEIKGLLKQSPVLVLGGMDLFARTILGASINPTKFTLIGGDGVCSKYLINTVTELGSTLYCSSQSDVLNLAKQEIDFSSEASKVYERLFKAPITLDAAMAADSIGVVLKAMCDAKSTESKAIARQLKSPEFVYRGAAGSYQFAEDGRNIRANGFLYRVNASGAKLETLLGSE